MQETALMPELVELVGLAALPVIAALEAPRDPALVAHATERALGDLCTQPSVPVELAVRARDALLASRRVSAGDRSAYAPFLRAMHGLLVEAGLPVPCELAD